MAGQSASKLTGDRAIHANEDDRLGFAPVAEQVAKALVDHNSENGLVVGIDGPWGSGKSSLLNLLGRALDCLPDKSRTSVINFRPWLVGDRDSLLASLFREITDAIDRVTLAQGDATPITLTRARDAATAARKFAAAIGRAGEFVEFAGELSSFVPVKWVGQGMKKIGLIQPQVPPPLSESKAKLVTALRELGHLFVITIDDVDRLEPNEAVEVLRLARAVADFPNIVHVLCFDGRILSKSIQNAAGIDDGEAFLEKIVQLTVTVPKPESFQLRNWFSDELKNIGAPRDEKGLGRLGEVVNWDGGRRLKTPRAVIRALDSIRFIWPALQAEGADFADLVWLQLIKNDNLTLYRWIEDYLSSQSVLALGIGQVDKADQEGDAQSLKEADPDGFFKSLSYRHHFADRLPGVDADYSDKAVAPKIYQNISKQDQEQAIAERRLASPDHYRLYFSLAAPSHTLTQAELSEFWEALEGTQDTAQSAFLQLYGRVVLGSFSKADVLLERLDASKFEGLSPDRCRNLLLLFASVLDTAFRARPFDYAWVNSIWDRAERLLPRLLGCVSADRQGVVVQMFKSGAAIDWLTNVLRKETFAHGRYGDRAKPEEDRILTDREFDAVAQIMIDRYRRLSADNLVSAIDPLNILFAWLQAGDEEGPRRLVRKAIKSDLKLVSLLESMRGTVTSTTGRYYTLKRGSLDPFMDFDKVRSRIEKLASADEGKPLTARARVLLQNFLAGDQGF